MLKLLKNEWKRYRLFSIIMIGISVLIGLLLVLIMLLISFNRDMDSNSEILAVGNIIMVSLIIYCIPYASVVYGILSYSTDIGRKGMIFLTPAPTWKIILSKLIYTSVFFVFLYVISRCSIMLSDSIASSYGISEKDITENWNLFSFIIWSKSDNITLIYSFIQYFVSVLHIVVLIMASISLGRFSANSVGLQVFLSILFYIAICIIKSITSLIIHVIIDRLDLCINYFLLTSWVDFGVSVISLIALYIISVCLTDKKVNLVS